MGAQLMKLLHTNLFAAQSRGIPNVCPKRLNNWRTKLSPPEKLKVEALRKQLLEHRMKNAGKPLKPIVEPRGSLVPFTADTLRSYEEGHQAAAGREPAVNIAQKFGELMEVHRQLLVDCHEALAPDKTEQERNVLRAALGHYLAATQQRPKPTKARS